MAQLGESSLNSLPGIVTDQPEIYESDPILNDDTDINDLDAPIGQPDESIALIEIPVKQAFSYFAEREHEITKFYVQRHGEYKISCSKPEDETDIEKYHRLVSEVNELLNKFQSSRRSRLDDEESTGGLNNKAITSNLEVLSKQLKALEFAAEDGSLSSTRAEFVHLKSKLEKLGEKVLIYPENDEHLESDSKSSSDAASTIRMSALERRLNMIETLLGHNEEKAQKLFRATNSDNIVDTVDTLSSWLSLFKPENVQRVGKELEYIAQQLEKVEEHVESGDASKADSDSRARLEQLCQLATTTDKYRVMVPTIIHRLSAMEELQQKAAQVSTTVNHLEQVQAQIVESLQSNKSELGSLNEMFTRNIDLIKDFSADIDARIAAIKEKNQKSE